MNCEQATESLFLRAEGELDLPATRALDEHLMSCPTCRSEAAQVEETWAMLGTLEQSDRSDVAASADNMRSRFFAMLEGATLETEPVDSSASGPAAAPRPDPHEPARGFGAWLEAWWPRQPAWQAALAAATLLFGIWIGPQFHNPAQPVTERNEIAELRNQMLSMNRVMTLSLLQHQSASERLRAVSLSQQSTRDEDVVGALLQVINQDDSVNVRLAALDVLAAMDPSRNVSLGLSEALPQQRSPTMQVALSEVLLAMDSLRTRSAVKTLLEDSNTLAPVREHLNKKIAEEGDSL